MKSAPFPALGPVAAIFSLGSMLLSPGPNAWSETTRIIKMVVSYPAGSPSDIPARLLGDQIGRAQGLAVVVENRPGASGTIGTEAVAKAAPDGNTLLFISPAFVIDPHLRKLHYDPFTSFEPICHLMSSPTVIVVNSASPYRTLADLLNDARIKPGVLTLAGVGPASTVHIAFETLKRAAGVNMTFVPYPGPPAAVSALLGGHLTSIFVPYAAVSAQLRAGTLRALATSSRSRIEALPEVPTVAESGFRDYEMDVWFGVVAPAKTPGEVLSQLAAWFASAMQVSEVKAKLVSQGLYPVGTCGADFAAYLRTRYNEYGRVIRESNIRAE